MFGICCVTSARKARGLKTWKFRGYPGPEFHIPDFRGFLALGLRGPVNDLTIRVQAGGNDEIISLLEQYPNIAVGEVYYANEGSYFICVS